MTLIMGSRCQDGIVIGTDTKELRGGEPGFENKIFERGGVALAVAGLTGIRDDFLLLLDYEMRRAKGFASLYEVKLAVEDIISELSKRYGERVEESDPVAVLLGGLTDLGSGPAQLYYIHGVGYGEAVGNHSAVCLGHGAPHATTLAKFVHDPQAAVSDMAFRIAFIIAWVSEDVDVTVGGTPQVAMLLDNSSDITYLDKGRLEEAIALSRKKKRDLVDMMELKRKLV